MSTHLLNGIVYDTATASRVASIKNASFEHLVRSGDFWDVYFRYSTTSSCVVYLGVNGTWFLFEERWADWIFWKERLEPKVVPLKPHQALKILHEMNAVEAAKQWFPEKIRDA